MAARKSYELTRSTSLRPLLEPTRSRGRPAPIASTSPRERQLRSVWLQKSRVASVQKGTTNSGKMTTLAWEAAMCSCTHCAAEKSRNGRETSPNLVFTASHLAGSAGRPAMSEGVVDRNPAAALFTPRHYQEGRSREVLTP